MTDSTDALGKVVVRIHDPDDAKDEKEILRYSGHGTHIDILVASARCAPPLGFNVLFGQNVCCGSTNKTAKPACTDQALCLMLWRVCRALVNALNKMQNASANDRTVPMPGKET